MLILPDIRSFGGSSGDKVMAGSARPLSNIRSRASLSLALLTAVALLGASPASALSFVFTTKSGDTLTSDQAAAFQAAADVWSSKLSDPMTVTLQIGFRSLGSNVLGSTSASTAYASASFVKGLVASDISSADDATAYNSLTNLSTSNIQLTSAQVRALGYNYYDGSGYDGTIEFSSDFNFSTSRNADGTIAGGTYDLIGIAEHEIAHVLGFDSAIDIGGNQTLLDQYRYSSAGTRSESAGAAYFSIDGGVTDIADFSSGAQNDYQASHWTQGTQALMAPAIAPGQTENVTGLDLRAMDVIGYNLISSVPEPATWGMMIVGFGAIGATMRGKRKSGISKAA